MFAQPLRFPAASRARGVSSRAAAHTRAVLERLLGPGVPVPCPAPRDLAVRLAECLLEVPPDRLARRSWCEERRGAAAAVLHHMGEMLGARAVWLVLPGRPAQAVPLDAETVLDNPFGFAALAGTTLALVDADGESGLWLGRDARQDAEGRVTATWELEAWGSEWTSALARARGGC